MRHTDHRDLRHRVHPVDRLLDLAAGHVLTAGLDHVLLAVDDRDVALGIDRGQVSAVKPASLTRRGRALLVLVVPLQKMRRPVDDLADRPRSNRTPGVVHHAGFDVERRVAGRPRLANLVVRLQHGRQRRDLGLSIQVPEPDVREPPAELAEYLDRHDRGTVVSLPQRRQVGLVEQRRTQQRDPDGRWREERRHLVPGDHRQDHLGLRLRHDDIARADIDRRPEEHIQLRAVIER